MAHKTAVILLFVLYIVIMTGIMIWQGIGIAPDRYAFVLLLGSLLIKRTSSFLFDWIPFLFILISYDFLRSLAPFVNSRVHYFELIWAEQFLFQTLPTVKLQEIYYVPGRITILDISTTILYFLHFALPLGFGFLLWIYDKLHFRKFVIALCLMSYAAWISYVIYPAAPPWLSQEKGYISGVHKIIDSTLAVFPEKLSLPTIYHQFNPNPVAAIPSMHAAYPLLVFLFAVSFFKKKALPFIFYVAGVWFATVYLGEHYVVDLLAGAVYAVGFFLITQYAYPSFIPLFFRKKET